MISQDTIRNVVGVIGNVIALGLFLSAVPTFYRILKKKTVEQFSAAPYLATLLNCMFWVVYGLPLVHPHSTLVLTINGSGMAIELVYVLLFLLYSKGTQRLVVLFALLAEITFVAAVALIAVNLAHTYDRRSLIVGIFCVFFGTLMYVAPLSVMKLVIQTKSVEYMPFFLSVASFFNGVCWTTYALIRFDLFITIPNSLGVIFAVVQLVLHAMYYNSTKRQLQERRAKEGTGLVEVVTIGDTNNKTSSATQKGHHASHQSQR